MSAELEAALRKFWDQEVWPSLKATWTNLAGRLLSAAVRARVKHLPYRQELLRSFGQWLDYLTGYIRGRVELRREQHEYVVNKIARPLSDALRRGIEERERTRGTA